MQTINDEIPKLKYTGRFKFIADHLNSKGLQHIGNPDRERHTITEGQFAGEIRSASLGMDYTARWGRTLTVVNLNETELFKMHDYEQNRMNRFLIPSEIRAITGSRWRFPRPLDTNQIEYIWQFTLAHKPKPKLFHNIVVPPYFPEDYGFDGMTWCHEFDRNIHFNRAQFSMPEFNGGRVSRRIEKERADING